MKIISIFNNKGGVGKSTLTYHLGSALAEVGKKVLLIDLDPQSNLSLYGLSEGDLEKIWEYEDEFIADYNSAKQKMSSDEFNEFHSKHHSIHYLLKPIEDGQSDEKVLSAPVHLRDNIDLIPGRLTLHLFENKLSKQWSDAFLGEPQAIRTITAIRKKCEEYAQQFGYDVIIIDTSPSLGPLNKVIISSSDAFIIPCAPDMFSNYGVRNIGNALSVWKKEYETMYSLVSDSKREYLPEKFVTLLGYTVYNAKKRTDAPNKYDVALAHLNYLNKLPDTIKKHIPASCLIDKEGLYDNSIGNNAVIHGHATLPTTAQKYRLPMWQIPDNLGIGSDKGTIKGNARKYYATKSKYIEFANDVLRRLELL